MLLHSAHLVKGKAREEVNGEADQRDVGGRVVHVSREITDDFVRLLKACSSISGDMDISCRRLPVPRCRCITVRNPLDFQVDLRNGGETDGEINRITVHDSRSRAFTYNSRSGATFRSTAHVQPHLLPVLHVGVIHVLLQLQVITCFPFQRERSDG